jgi:hypothetical protein
MTKGIQFLIFSINSKAYAKNEIIAKLLKPQNWRGKKNKKKTMIFKELCLSNSILYYKTYKETH